MNTLAICLVIVGIANAVVHIFRFVFSTHTGWEVIDRMITIVFWVGLVFYIAMQQKWIFLHVKAGIQ